MEIYFFIGSVVLLVAVTLCFWLVCFFYKRARDLAPYFTTIEALKEQIAQADKVKAEREQKLMDLHAELAQAQSTIQNAKVEKEWLDENKSTIDALKLHIITTKEELGAVTQKLEKTKDDLMAKQMDLQNCLAELQAKQMQNNQLIAENAHLEKQLEKNGIELDSTVADLEYKSKALAKVEVSLHEMCSNLETLKSQKNNLLDEKNKLQVEISSSQERLQQLQTSNHEEQLRHNKLITENDHVNKQLQKKRVELAEMNNQLDKIRNALSSDKQTLSDVQHNTNTLKVEKQLLEKKIDRKQRKLNQLDEDIQIRSTRLSSMPKPELLEKHRWAELDTPVPSINISNPEQFEEHDWLERFADNLNAAHFKFHPRTIKAFHTSLKVEDESPMVVLAGISGTGKSLLPELYAHAIGMNFLQVPVQPRWDSPQDLLGFYNYMEGRYKPTELLRLLWQTDRYNNPDEARNHPAMNMILLDEMNLARVEYYFSEFLSKLEVRRGLNPDNADKRKAAEILLEGGVSAAGNSSRRVFVGSHNLFVGTMNEDESTQSLSDKVMDRSNMIRFAHPQEFKDKVEESTKKGFLDKYEDKMMTWDNWRKWHHSSAVDRALSDQMMAINNQMAKVGRPFGYRMWRSVLSYVRQYPGDKHDAMVDQIEMKILPRLSGLDLSEPSLVSELKNLAATLEAFHDSDLTSAFNIAMDSKKLAFFQWRGIPR